MIVFVNQDILFWKLTRILSCFFKRLYVQFDADHLRLAHKIDQTLKLYIFILCICGKKIWKKQTTSVAFGAVTSFVRSHVRVQTGVLVLITERKTNLKDSRVTGCILWQQHAIKALHTVRENTNHEGHRFKNRPCGTRNSIRKTTWGVHLLLSWTSVFTHTHTSGSENEG